MNRRLQAAKYIFFDTLTAILAWATFFIFRKYQIQDDILQQLNLVFADDNLYKGLVFIPLFWLALYTGIGSYNKIYRKSRLRELGQTLLITLIGTLILFFALILDDIEFHGSYKIYYRLLSALFLIQFTFTYIPRLLLTNYTVKRIHNRKIGFPTLIIGGNGKATEIYNEIENQYKSAGNQFVGFVNVKNNPQHQLSEHLPHLGSYNELISIIKENKIEEVIIAIDPEEHTFIGKILTELEQTNVMIKVIPDMHDILLGSVKMTAIFHAPLIHIYPDLMPAWQKSLKRVIDIVASVSVLLFMSPLYIFTAIGVKLSSPGPIFYTHERIGKNGKPFKMHKYRSMFIDAEKHGPQLSSKNDPRITKFGLFMRKFRLDEIPQFYNVLIGDMSLVGFRPERQYYIDQIVQEAPHYRLLLKIKPGITSWGQVKFGYAENVKEMVERLRYDILYLENMSLITDFKILIYTVIIVFMGRGK